MNDKQKTRISKFLSLVLRHKPETIGLQLDENGWTDVKELIKKTNSSGGIAMTFTDLEEIVDTNEKKRFAFNEYKTRIRASQGHSVNIDLALTPMVPPDVLFHGTAQQFVGSILQKGLVKGQRNHVHLSSDRETAHKVGSRHGKVQLFEVDAKLMNEDGLLFFKSDNDVWLTDNVPFRYLAQVY